ncbi:MAG: hypothetical protein EYC68_22185 [Chloroflexota bacterium]|nr:MAG: hypothetical protein EYC68_22185 [Chloroflexota bacterium]
MDSPLNHSKGYQQLVYSVFADDTARSGDGVQIVAETGDIPEQLGKSALQAVHIIKQITPTTIDDLVLSAPLEGGTRVIARWKGKSNTDAVGRSGASRQLIFIPPNDIGILVHNLSDLQDSAVFAPLSVSYKKDSRERKLAHAHLNFHEPSFIEKARFFRTLPPSLLPLFWNLLDAFMNGFKVIVSGYSGDLQIKLRILQALTYFFPFSCIHQFSFATTAYTSDQQIATLIFLSPSTSIPNPFPKKTIELNAVHIVDDLQSGIDHSYSRMIQNYIEFGDSPLDVLLEDIAELSPPVLSAEGVRTSVRSLSIKAGPKFWNFLLEHKRIEPSYGLSLLENSHSARTSTSIDRPTAKTILLLLEQGVLQSDSAGRNKFAQKLANWFSRSDEIPAAVSQRLRSIPNDRAEELIQLWQSMPEISFSNAVRDIIHSWVDSTLKHEKELGRFELLNHWYKNNLLSPNDLLSYYGSLLEKSDGEQPILILLRSSFFQDTPEHLLGLGKLVREGVPSNSAIWSARLLRYLWAPSRNERDDELVKDVIQHARGNDLLLLIGRYANALHKTKFLNTKYWNRMSQVFSGANLSSQSRIRGSGGTSETEQSVRRIVEEFIQSKEILEIDAATRGTVCILGTYLGLEISRLLPDPQDTNQVNQFLDGFFDQSLVLPNKEKVPFPFIKFFPAEQQPLLVGLMFKKINDPRIAESYYTAVVNDFAKSLDGNLDPLAMGKELISVGKSFRRASQPIYDATAPIIFERMFGGVSFSTSNLVSQILDLVKAGLIDHAIAARAAWETILARSINVEQNASSADYAFSQAISFVDELKERNKRTNNKIADVWISAENMALYFEAIKLAAYPLDALQKFYILAFDLPLGREYGLSLITNLISKSLNQLDEKSFKTYAFRSKLPPPSSKDFRAWMSMEWHPETIDQINRMLEILDGLPHPPDSQFTYKHLLQQQIFSLEIVDRNEALIKYILDYLATLVKIPHEEFPNRVDFDFGKLREYYHNLPPNDSRRTSIDQTLEILRSSNMATDKVLGIQSTDVKSHKSESRLKRLIPR